MEGSVRYVLLKQDERAYNRSIVTDGDIRRRLQLQDLTNLRMILSIRSLMLRVTCYDSSVYTLCWLHLHAPCLYKGDFSAFLSDCETFQAGAWNVVVGTDRIQSPQSPETHPIRIQP